MSKEKGLHPVHKSTEQKKRINKLSVFYFENLQNESFQKEWRQLCSEYIEFKVSNSNMYMLSMYQDKRRMDFYKSIIKENCKDKVVFEIGAGAGFLSTIAAKNGAKSVYAFEANPKMAEIAKTTFRNNGVEDIVHLIEDTTFAVDEDSLPKADIIIHELVTSDPFGENLLLILSDIKRFCHEGTIFLPEKLEIGAQFIKATGPGIPRKDLYKQDDIDTSAISQLFQSRFNHYPKQGEYQVLSETINFFELKFSDIDNFKYNLSLDNPIKNPTEDHFLMTYFTLKHEDKFFTSKPEDYFQTKDYKSFSNVLYRLPKAETLNFEIFVNTLVLK